MACGCRRGPTLRALGSRVLLRAVPEPETYGSGLLVRPDDYRHRRAGEGVVVSLGPGVEVPGLSIGEYVLVNSLHGSEFEVDGRTYVFVDEADVLALLPWPEDVEVPEAVVGADRLPG